MMAQWRVNILKIAFNQWHTVDVPALKKVVEEQHMTADQFKEITGQDYVNDQPQENNTGATQG